MTSFKERSDLHSLSRMNYEQSSLFWNFDSQVFSLTLSVCNYISKKM